MPSHSLARVSCALIFAGVALHGHAASYANAEKSREAGSGVEFGFDIGVERAHQEFSDSNADLTTVSFVPRAMFGNWELSLDLPWQRAEGGYFVNNNFPPKVEYVCQALSAGTLAAAQQFPRLAARYLNRCQAAGVLGTVDDSVSGISDATLFLRYGLPLDEQGIWLLSAGGGYKFDNGDSDKNLGSGTRNTLLEASLGVSYGWFIGSATAGYAWVNATDATDTKSNYTYGVIDAGIRPLAWLTLGCNWSSDESYYSGGETVQKTTAYVRVKPFDHLGVKVYASDYGDTEGYPDREYGASIYYSY
jgi:hypothetical protein